MEQEQDVQPVQLLAQNKKYLQLLPQLLAKHLDIYQNIHRDIDPNDKHHSHFRTIQDNSESYTKQLINASSEFVDTIAALKSNFIKLIDLTPNCPAPISPNSHNFTRLVSQHSRNTTLDTLKRITTPIIYDSEFQKYQQ